MGKHHVRRSCLPPSGMVDHHLPRHRACGHPPLTELRRRLTARLQEEEVTASPLLSLQDISVTLGDREVVRNVSLDIARGESVALVGESGSGKTVTARVITGLIDRIGGRVTNGQLRFDGKVLDQDDPDWKSF